MLTDQLSNKSEELTKSDDDKFLLSLSQAESSLTKPDK
jgi:hypothetical protein